MAQKEKLPSMFAMFAGSAEVELKSEKRIEKIFMPCNGVLNTQTKLPRLQLESLLKS